MSYALKPLSRGTGSHTQDYDNKSSITSSSASCYILVLDDEPDTTSLIENALQRNGYNVFGFTDPLLALEHFKLNSKNYSLVISDLRMPVMNGFEFIMNIRHSRPEIRIVIMTAFNVNDDSEFAMHFEAQKIDGFIQKPISLQRLNEIISQII